jgi:geranylgeranyl diphosphate synthase type II
MLPDSYKEFATAFEAYFSSIKKDLPATPGNLYDPVRYFLELDGKRIRPLLALIASDCFHGETRHALPAAAAVELFHNFSLIHDDIMDEAPLRRGRQTVHEKWNRNIAILSGDVLLVKAYQQIVLCKQQEVEKVFSQTAVEVCEGQQYDMDFEKQQQVHLSSYLDMIRLKTAVLLAASLQMGALCAGASQKHAAQFYTAGENLGMAFQLTDDYLDVFGDASKTGKQQGGDIISNKKTWLLIKALELANPTQLIALETWIVREHFDPQEKVQEVRKIFSELNLAAMLEKEIEVYYSKAFADLHAACPHTDKVDAFITFIKTLMRREK